MLPSATGRVSSNTVAFVKLRMLKLSSHFSGHACSLPSCRYSTRIFRANIFRFKHRKRLPADLVAPHPAFGYTLSSTSVTKFARDRNVLATLGHSRRFDRRMGGGQDHER